MENRCLFCYEVIPEGRMVCPACMRKYTQNKLEPLEGESKMKYDWKKWAKAAGIRAIKTFAQTAVGMLSGELVGILEVNWLSVLSVSATSAVLSILTSLAGLPEVENAE